MEQFDLSRYIVSTIPDEQRTPEETVTEYVMAFQKWARDCHHIYVQNRDALHELQVGDARKMMLKIQEKYCISKNRQYSRTHTGCYFYNGTYDVYLEGGLTVQNMDERNCVITTEKKDKPYVAPFRFSLKKLGKTWRIDLLEQLSAKNLWEWSPL
jgi:NTF2 fold immunity protein